MAKARRPGEMNLTPSPIEVVHIGPFHNMADLKEWFEHTYLDRLGLVVVSNEVARHYGIPRAICWKCENPVGR